MKLHCTERSACSSGPWLRASVCFLRGQQCQSLTKQRCRLPVHELSTAFKQSNVCVQPQYDQRPILANSEFYDSGTQTDNGSSPFILYFNSLTHIQSYFPLNVPHSTRKRMLYHISEPVKLYLMSLIQSYDSFKCNSKKLNTITFFTFIRISDINLGLYTDKKHLFLMVNGSALL